MTKNKHQLIAVVTVCLSVLGACTGERGVFGEDKKAPDEFAVYSRAPLSLPPEFGLRPPQPGATRPQVVAPRNDAKEALLSSGGNPAGQPPPPPVQGNETLSPGMIALIKNAGGDKAEPNIRALVNSETTSLSSSDDFTDSILFWRDGKALKGAVIDPVAEERRIRNKQATSGSIEEGGAIIQRRERGGGTTSRGDGKGFWESLFD
ncbi:MAG: DUF3035 domain-containing protein [Rhodospirillaceae bacterium]|nr:DUF3035 domain-containing protein [Rhodospirillaceae bacterium]